MLFGYLCFFLWFQAKISHIFPPVLVLVGCAACSQATAVSSAALSVLEAEACTEPAVPWGLTKLPFEPQLCLLEGEPGRCLCFLRALGAGLHGVPAGWCTRCGCDFVAVSFSRSWPGAQPCCSHPFPTSCSTGLQGLRAWQTLSMNLEEPCTHAEEEEVPGTAGT